MFNLMKRVYLERKKAISKKKNYSPKILGLSILKKEIAKIESLYKKELKLEKLKKSKEVLFVRFWISFTDTKFYRNPQNLDQLFDFFLTKLEGFFNSFYFYFLPACWDNFFKPTLFIAKYFIKKLFLFNLSKLSEPKILSFTIQIIFSYIALCAHWVEVKWILSTLIFYFFTLISIILTVLAFRYRVGRGVLGVLLLHLFALNLLYILIAIPVCVRYFT